MVNKPISPSRVVPVNGLGLHYIESAIRKVEKNPGNHDLWNSAKRMIVNYADSVFSDWNTAHSFFQRLEKQAPALAKATDIKDAGAALLVMHLLVEKYAHGPEAQQYADYLERQSLRFYRQQNLTVAAGNLLNTCMFESRKSEAKIPTVTVGQVHNLRQAVRLLVEGGEPAKAELVLDHLQLATIYHFTITLATMPKLEESGSDVALELEKQNFSFSTLRELVRATRESPINLN